MPGHMRAISCLSLDPAGARLASGSLDKTVKLWDFNGMDQRFRSFREFEPSEVSSEGGISHEQMD